MKKVFLTGATGIMGMEAVKRFAEHSDEIALYALARPGKKNEVSGLLIMGIFGGTVFPLIMGIASDAMGQVGAVLVMTLGIFYLLGYFVAYRRK